MILSLRWLNSYVSVDDYLTKAPELAKVLTNAGLEVESIQYQSQTYNDVVVGHILEKNQHPDADKLSLCLVSTGEGVVHQIVCGAKNHKAGDRIVVALPGAVLPGDFKISKSKIRGVESNGMLCSAKELGISSDSEGLLILDSNAAIGQNFADYWGLNDVLLTLKVTPNRADCLSHLGLAREIACLLGRKWKFPAPQFPIGDFKTQDVLSVQLEAKELCLRYSGRVVRNVKVGPSPKWLQQCLENLGMNSINNIVDVTNYVMLEMGQPLHAFDLKHLSTGKIIIERAKDKQAFTSLDSTEYTLSTDDLIIGDSNSVLALAGVVGGKNSGVSDETNSIFIECANFLPSGVRRSSRRYGIDTASAYRFARGVDIEASLQVLDRCVHLICELAGGQASSDIVDIYPNIQRSQEIVLSQNYVSQRLGFSVKKEDLENCIQRLDCKVRVESNSNDTVFYISSPSYRGDLKIPEDFVEEYARLFGYEQMPDTIPLVNSAPKSHTPEYLQAKQVRDELKALGALEAINLAFINDKVVTDFIGNFYDLQTCGIKASEKFVKIKNPLSEDYNILRPSLSPGLFKNMLHNQRHNNSNAMLFEVGHIFSQNEAKYLQYSNLAIIAWGRKTNLWQASSAEPLVLSLKHRIELLLQKLGVAAETVSWQMIKSCPKFLHPGQSMQLLLNQQPVGYLGTLHPSLMEESKLREESVIAEFDLAGIFSAAKAKMYFNALSAFPSVQRDLAIILDKSVSAADLVLEAKRILKNTASKVEIFDLYEGEKVEAGKKSLALKLQLQSYKATMDDAEIQKIMSSLTEALTKKFAAELR